MSTARDNSGRESSSSRSRLKVSLGTARYKWLLDAPLAGLDALKVLRPCMGHGLGDALHGNMPAVEQAAHPDQSAQELADHRQLTSHLDSPLRKRILGQCDDYEHGRSAEARAVKALGKLEALRSAHRDETAPALTMPSIPTTAAAVPMGTHCAPPSASGRSRTRDGLRSSTDMSLDRHRPRNPSAAGRFTANEI